MLLQSDKAIGRKHMTQREVAKDLEICQRTVGNISKKRKLKCFRRVKCQVLKDIHKERRKARSENLLADSKKKSDGKFGGVTSVVLSCEAH